MMPWPKNFCAWWRKPEELDFLGIFFLVHSADRSCERYLFREKNMSAFVILVILGTLWLWWQVDADGAPGLTQYRLAGTVLLLVMGTFSLLPFPLSAVAKSWLVFGESAVASAVVIALAAFLAAFGLMGWQGNKKVDNYYVLGVILLAAACAFVAYLVGGKIALWGSLAGAVGLGLALFCSSFCGFLEGLKGGRI
jgi:hypothetical protein